MQFPRPDSRDDLKGLGELMIRSDDTPVVVGAPGTDKVDRSVRPPYASPDLAFAARWGWTRRVRDFYQTLPSDDVSING